MQMSENILENRWLVNYESLSFLRITKTQTTTRITVARILSATRKQLRQHEYGICAKRI